MTTKDTAKQVSTANKRQFEGIVIGSKANKTISVAVNTRKTHQKYKKQYTSTKKYAVHDAKNEAQAGDTVSFAECRPMSKTKKWRLLSVVKKSQ